MGKIIKVDYSKVKPIVFNPAGKMAELERVKFRGVFWVGFYCTGAVWERRNDMDPSSKHFYTYVILPQKSFNTMIKNGSFLNRVFEELRFTLHCLMEGKPATIYSIAWYPLRSMDLKAKLDPTSPEAKYLRGEMEDQDE